MEVICSRYHHDNNCLHDLAEEYGLTTADIISIYQETLDRRAESAERRLEYERNCERKQDRGWDDYLESELKRRKQELESGASV